MMDPVSRGPTWLPRGQPNSAPVIWAPSVSGFACAACFAAGVRLLLGCQLVALGQFQLGFGVGHVAENLHASGILLGRENSVVLVNRQTRQRAELSGQQSMAAHPDQQLAFGRKDLHSVLHGVGHPDMPVGIDRDALGPREVSGTVTGLAECADEVSIGVEDLDPVVEGVG